jgi:integrase
LSANRGKLQVRRVIQHVPGKTWEWAEPKTANGERVIVFPGTLAAKITEHRKAQLEMKLRARSYWKDNDLVMCKPNGAPLRTSLLCHRFKKMLIRGGLPTEIRPYDLRHFFVTSSLAAEVDAKTVSREAGHSQVSFTLQRYGHVLPEMHEAACDKRERLLRNRK